MSIVVDSSVWIDVVIRAPGWQRFSPLLAKSGEVLIPSVVLAEVGKWFLRQEGEGPAGKVLAHLMRHEVVALDAELAVRAARAAVEFRLSLGDSIIFATAIRNGSELITMDAHFDGLPGVRYFAKVPAN